MKITIEVEEIKDELGGEVLDSDTVSIEFFQGDLSDNFLYMLIGRTKYIVRKSQFVLLSSIQAESW